MSVPGWLSISLYCTVMLTFLYGSVRKQNRVNRKGSSPFEYLLLITLFAFVADMASRLYDGPAFFYPFAVAGSYLKYILIPSSSLLWFRYLTEQIFGEQKILVYRNWMIALTAINGLNAVITLSSGLTGWAFYYDAQHQYHRGPFYHLAMAIMLMTILVAELFLFRNRRRIERRNYCVLMFFPVPPFLCGLLQTFLYGLPFTLIGISFSLLIIFIYIQNRNMNVDYLTGVYNRRWLDIRMREMISASGPDRTFSAILVDLDGFKSINDVFGHLQGDAALEQSTILLRQCLRADDIVTRYGGDEFCILLQTSVRQEIEEVIARIRAKSAAFNAAGKVPYHLDFSMGYAVYAPLSGQSMEAFQQAVDREMYADKHRKYPMEGSRAESRE